MKAEEIKDKQKINLQIECAKQGIDIGSMVKLLDSEKNKKLSKRNQYILQTINNEIEKSLNHENK